jgi:ribosomal protein S6E (S10)
LRVLLFVAKHSAYRPREDGQQRELHVAVKSQPSHQRGFNYRN